MKRLTIILTLIAGLFASTAPAQQITPPLPVAVISCGLQARTKPPGFFGRLFHRTRKKASLISIYHESDFRLLVPETAARWRQDEARRLGLHVPSRFCASALASYSQAISLAAAAAHAATK